MIRTLYRNTFLVVCLSMPALGLWAQQPFADRKLPNGQATDYTYSLPELPQRCVLFNLKDTVLYYSPAKGKVLPYRIPRTTERTAGHWVRFVQKNPKLKADEVLLLQAAVAAWDTAKMNIGFTLLPSGLGYKITQAGNGKPAEKGKRVYVHYRGYLQDGKEFDNSFKRGQPIDIILGAGQVIKGWDEGIALFKVGDQGTLKIPPQMGYGERGVPGVIPANATLYFDIEVVRVD